MWILLRIKSKIEMENACKNMKWRNNEIQWNNWLRNDKNLRLECAHKIRAAWWFVVLLIIIIIIFYSHWNRTKYSNFSRK